MWRGTVGDLIIEGDNFDALRYLKMTYSGRVKCIYIDPPYNTGNKDFVYNDRFVDREDSWRHSTWCEFMWQRLTLAKDLLREDGVIFVSIDDNEVAPLRLMMDRIFGTENFVANCIWQKRYSASNDHKTIAPLHDYIWFFRGMAHGNATSCRVERKRIANIAITMNREIFVLIITPATKVLKSVRIFTTRFDSRIRGKRFGQREPVCGRILRKNISRMKNEI